MSDDTTTPDETTDADGAPAYVAPEGHTHVLDEAITSSAASGPMVWDESLPADGIVEHNSPGEFVDSLQYAAAPADDTPADPVDDKPAKKAPAKKAAAKKAPAKASGAKAAT